MRLPSSFITGLQQKNTTKTAKNCKELQKTTKKEPPKAPESGLQQKNTTKTTKNCKKLQRTAKKEPPKAPESSLI